MRKALILVSGGWDSTTLLYKKNTEASEKLTALLIDYGQKHSVELLYAMKHLKALGIDSVKSLDCRSVYHNIDKATLFRNGVFISLATAVAMNEGCQNIYIATCQDDANNYVDCRRDFFGAMQTAVFAGSDGKVQLYAPFLNTSKIEVVRQGLNLGIKPETTWWCYKGGEEPCGQCLSCRTMQAALEKLDVTLIGGNENE